MKAPRNSTIQPHFNFTIPASFSFHDAKGIKLKYSDAWYFTANRVNENRRIRRTPKILVILTLLLTIPNKAPAQKAQHMMAR